MNPTRRMFVWVRLALLFSVVTVASKVEAHWCNDLWGSGYNIVVRPASDVVSVPASGQVTLDLYVQNNMGYLLPNFSLTATASGYTISAARQTTVRAGYLMPTENAKYTLTISKSGGGSLAVTAMGFAVGFGSGQDGLYGGGSGDVIVRNTSGTLSPSPATGIGVASADQAYDLAYAANADFGNKSQGIDSLLQFYCVGRGSWSGSDVDTAKCPTATSSICVDASGLGTGNGDKYQYQHLWAATELGARKSTIDAGRTADLRKRLQCGASDANLGFAGIAMVVLGYLGEDATARAYLQTQIGVGGDRGTIAKAALVLMGNGADLTTHQAALTAGLSSGNVFVSAACATALGIVANNDAAVTNQLVNAASWTEPDTGDNGKGFYASNLLSLVAWHRRGWAFGGADVGAISFYGSVGPTCTDGSKNGNETDTDCGGPTCPKCANGKACAGAGDCQSGICTGTVCQAPPADPQAPAGPACQKNADGSVRIGWSSVSKDVNSNPVTVTGYKVYYGTAARPAGALKPGDTSGFDYGHSTAASGTYADYPGLSGTAPTYFAVTALSATNASAYSTEISCTPTYAPVAKISCAPLAGAVPPNLSVSCNGNASTDQNGASDIATYAFSLAGGSTQTTNPATFTISAPGNYDIQLVVKDKAGLSSAPSATTIAVADSASGNLPPVAKASGSPLSGVAPLAVSFSASASSDPDGAIASYAWDFGDGAKGTGVSTSHTFQTSGTFTVALSVTDNGAKPITSHTSVTVTVKDYQPLSLTTVSATPSSGNAPLAVHFDGTGVTDPGGGAVTLTWDFGDGSPKVTGASADHTYRSGGTFTATVTARTGQDAGAPSSKTFTIVVQGGAAPDGGSGGRDAASGAGGAGGSSGSDASVAGGGDDLLFQEPVRGQGSCGCALAGARSGLGALGLVLGALGILGGRRRRNRA